MNISAELSLYPLGQDYKATIKAYIATLNTFDTLEVCTHALSTEIFGSYDDVFSAIQQATQTVFEQDSAAALVVKLLNRDRR